MTNERLYCELEEICNYDYEEMQRNLDSLQSMLDSSKELEELEQENRLKDLLFEEFKEHDDYDDIINDLRSLNTEKTITNEEYNTILANYDAWLLEYESEDQE